MTFIISAASPTVRVIGPACDIVPNVRKRINRHATIGRLQSEDAGERGRHADRAAAVGAQMQTRPCQARQRPPHRRSTRPGLAHVPRIARDTEQRQVRDALPADLRRRRLAEQHRARLAQTRHAGASSVRRRRWRQLRRAPRRPAFREHQFLNAGQHAVDGAQRRAAHPPRFRCARGFERAVLVDQAKGVHGAVERHDAPQRRTRRLDAATSARAAKACAVSAALQHANVKFHTAHRFYRLVKLVVREVELYPNPDGAPSGRARTMHEAA